MDTSPDIIPMSQRRYEEIPVDQIKVINSRNRDQEQFDMNIGSIDHVGLMKPIRVNDKFLDRSEMYELICGEGRLLAHQKLGHKTIVAEVVTCTRKDAYLQSLVENIARTKRGSMYLARELKRLHDEGWDFKRIAGISVKSERYIRDYIRLVEQGEERLINGVEQGVFPISFAVQIAATDDGQIQTVLMDSFDEGIVTTKNFAQARRIITQRAKENRKRNGSKTYTVSQLREDIVEATKVKTSYVREAKTKENRFMTLLNGINALWKDAELLKILRDERLENRPDLAGDFRYES
jgi:ParB family chromosome partitioning protein